MSDEEFVDHKKKEEAFHRCNPQLTHGSLSRGNQDDEEHMTSEYLDHCLKTDALFGHDQAIYDKEVVEGVDLETLIRARTAFEATQYQKELPHYYDIVEMAEGKVSEAEHSHERALDRELLGAMYRAESQTHGLEFHGPTPQPVNELPASMKVRFKKGFRKGRRLREVNKKTPSPTPIVLHNKPVMRQPWRVFCSCSYQW